MTGWAWFWFATTWFLAATWCASLWVTLRTRPESVTCACGAYRLNGWDKVRDDTALHDAQRCQPRGEAL